MKERKVRRSEIKKRVVMVCEKKHKNEWVRRNGMWGRGVGNKRVK